MRTQATAAVMDKREPKSSGTVRLTPEAVRWAKVVIGYTDETIAGYISRVVIESAQRDAERLHAEMMGKAGEPPKPGKGKA